MLTGFGVFWGMMMLLVLVGVGNSFVNGMKFQVGSMPSNTIMMGSSRTGKPYRGMPQGRWWSIQQSDLDVIARESKTADLISPLVYGGTGDKNVRYGSRYGTYQPRGILPVYSQLYVSPILYGRFINETDIAGSRKVCVIGHKVYEQLFPDGGNPCGELIHISNIQYRIVGVFAKQKQGFGDNSEEIMMPLTTLQRAYNKGENIDQLVVSARKGIRATEVEKDVKSILKRLHTIAPDDEKAIWSWNMEEMFTGINMVILGLNVLLWLIGLGTLISGAIGVTNIMLVTIRERTREIGIRRALGASPWVIVRQILAESLLLTGLSGIMGIMAGIGIISALAPLLNNPSSDMPLTEPEVSFSLAMGSLVIIIVIGLLAGLMPALRALKIKPIEALSEE